MQCDLKKILLTTCCLTLSACGGTGLDGPIFSIDPASPTDSGNNDYSPINLTESRTFQASSVVMDRVDHEDHNNPSKFENLDPAIDEVYVGAETNPSHVDINGNATIHYDASDQSFSLTVNQGNIDYFHHYREAQDRVATTDGSLYYESYDEAGNLYTLDISNPGVSRVFSALSAPHQNLTLSYMSFGMWSAQQYPLGVAGYRDAHGGIAFGKETQSADMPITGSASYTGATVGYMDIHTDTELVNLEAYNEAVADAFLAGDPAPPRSDYTIETSYHESYNLEGEVIIDVNFDALTLDAFFNNMIAAPVNGASAFEGSWLDFHSSLPLTSGSNNFAGTASTNSPWLHGTIMGAFYGPATSGAPAEVGGIWSLYDPTDQEVRAVGSFGAKKD